MRDLACLGLRLTDGRLRLLDQTRLPGEQTWLDWSPAAAPVRNPAFDITPAALVTGWILDSGVYDRAQVAAGPYLQRARQQ